MLVNTFEFSEIPRFGLTRAPRGSYEWVDWWVEQRKRCLEGYSIGGTRITGNHYFYLNFWKIRGVNKLLFPEQRAKRIVPPRFLEMDWDFFNEWERCKKEGKNFGVFKKRQCGASEKVSSICGYEFTFVPASQTVIMSGQEMYAENTMRFVHRGLNELAGTEFFKKRTAGLEYSIARKRGVNRMGQEVWVGFMSELYLLTTKVNAEAASRLSPSLAVFEEMGKFPKMNETYGFIKPSLFTENNLRTGFAIFLGTSTDIEEGLEALTDIVYNPDKYDCMEYDDIYTEGAERKICYFIPGYRYKIIDKDGNDLKEESLKQMDIERDKAAKDPDPAEIVKVVIAEPKDPDEAIMHFKGGRFDSAKLNKQRARLRMHKDMNIAFRADLQWRRDGKPTAGFPEGKVIGVDIEKDARGPFTIVVPPLLDEQGKPMRHYYGGTDSYDKDEALTSLSKGSTSIFNGLEKRYDARLTQRPPSADVFYENSAKLCYAYGATNLIEWSNTRIFDWFQNNMLYFLLKERPRFAYANVKVSKVNNKYGVDPSTKESWIKSYQTYIYNFADRMFDMEQIERAVRYNDEVNCDITIGAALAYVNYLDTVRFQHQPTTVKERRKTWGYKLKGGILIQSY